ncbi:gamma-glutamyl-gamma-aminobutyrate hydrolase family protein [Facklamia sp. 7083-14-GEN3]|uniref:gamma-glutamyl-gamma-aminobutyrate hydrolase family protein n=1 Tax=Facklamia sp. 7083-14-GEN3 TaxID=2973478 RepID=UPI00215C6322|nr:gamma-glutamyl-gamma-aminobutyrate hydrolase family protein [Facklamia sp. 7083-14-GEN3]MCR8969035.1 gamma-glutamyl-gamma-aminobutyrate hydrolase family protein [Facklamia sp. 7083-14-GEN3]
MQPIIAITGSITPIQNDPNYAAFNATYTPHFFVEAVIEAGGIPLVLPINNHYPIEAIIDRVDGLLLTGGQDVDPRFYQEEPHLKLGSLNLDRDHHELKLIKHFMQAGKPILGICRGMQLINVYQGGNLYQDLSLYPDWAIQHVQKSELDRVTHRVKIAADSRLSKWMGTGDYVNSLHHQAIKELGKDLKAIAWSGDQLVEAFESTDPNVDILAVQWHPELTHKHQESSRAIFKDLVERAKNKK